MGRVSITVLFTDIVGSTELRSTIGDDEADHVVAHHDTTVGELVTKHSGRVIKYLGDGALATFASAVDAVEAATAIRDALETSGPPIRIGLHAGDVEASEDDISGLPVAVASRLCGLAPPGGIIASGLVRSLVGVRGDLGFESIGAQALKGVAEPVEAWSVASERPAAEAPMRLAAPSLGRQTGRFVGRQDDLSRLDEALASLRRQYLIAVSGEPGIGKTALVGQWATTAHAGGATVLVGSAPPEGVAPYQPFLEAIRPLIRADPSLRPTGAGAGNLARLVPELAAGATPRPVVDDPDTERYLINEAFVEVLATAADRHAPLIVILDDLHWADEASIVLLGHLLRHTSDVPVLVVGTYRDTDLDRRHPLSDLLRDQRRDRRAERLDLTGLAPAEIASLVSTVAGGKAPEAALDVITSETEGNPFFIEEVVEHLLADGMVVDGAWTFDARTAMTIPEGIRDTIGRRLDRLSDDGQDLLAAASVIGASFGVDILVEVAKQPLESVEVALEEVLSAGFLIEGRSTQLSFSHALVRQTLLDEISFLRKSRLHRAAGEALAAAGASDDALIHHWIEAREYPKALATSLRAMRAAEGVAAHSAVISHANTTLDLWDEVDPADRPDGIQRHQPIVAAGLALGISEGSLEGVEYLQSHRTQLEREGDPLSVGVILVEEARHLWPLGRVAEARQAADRALELIPAAPPTAERARAEAQLGRALMLGGTDLDRATEVTQAALATAQAVDDPLTETAALITLGPLLRDPAEAERILRRGLEMATAQNAAFQITRARTNLSEHLANEGRHDEAIELMAEGMEIVKKLGGRGQASGWMVANLAGRLLAVDRWTEALETLDTPIPTGYPESTQLLTRAEILSHRGDLAAAGPILDEESAKYDGITDLQARLLRSTALLWFVRWSNQPGAVSEETLDVLGNEIDPALAPTLDYLFAASETAAWARERGELAGRPSPFPKWLELAGQVDAHEAGETIRATLQAQRARSEGTSTPDLWEAAATGLPDGSFRQAVVVSAWLNAVEHPTETALAAGAVALATAERLGAVPLAAELRHGLSNTET